MRGGAAVLAALALVAVSLGLASTPASAQGCVVWAGQLTLQQTVNQNNCVQLPPGLHILDRYLILPSGHTLQGDPSVSRDQVVLAATEGWVNNQGDGVVNDDGFGGQVATLRHFTIDGRGVSTGGVGARRLAVDDMAVTGGTCWGVAVAGEKMTVTNSWIHHNGADPRCFGAPGAGIYMVTQKPAGQPSVYSPVVTGNRVSDNIGPGLDIAGVWSGTLTNNQIVNNSSWAGVSLFGSQWLIDGNTVRHPATHDGQPYIHSCRAGPNGVRSAAIFLCQRTDVNNAITVNNTITNNKVSSWYGILLVGNDGAHPYLAPRHNMIAGNDAFGSHNGYADDFRPGQWFGDQNDWKGSKPAYF
jgi:parallel beta-helix repeat protein